MVETLNDYSHTVTETEIDRPNNLYTKSQLREAIEEIVADDVDVSVSNRMTRTVAKVGEKTISGDVDSVKVSFKLFDEEENRYTAGNGWEVVVSALRNTGALAE